FASFCVGPDGSVFTYSRDYEVVALDPDTGAEIAVSEPIPHGTTFSARIAVDAQGWVYLTNGGFDNGAVYAFRPDLTTAWSEPLVGVNVGGPVLSEDGTLVVCGTGTDVRAYATPQSSVDGYGVLGSATLMCAPNPFRSAIEIRYELAAAGFVRLQIVDVQGRRVRELLDGGRRSGGGHATVWDGTDRDGAPVPNGVYFATLKTAGEQQVHKLILQR
ncbi:MAG: T9SS type A sorting domain-containing protein, partial [Candidatus Eisenbacteria bacterium]|nr:T9SS type A sorting domain-containing protein [Candidatus Eisenbacteria bacterium]